jgi:predicted transcriptional regulator
VLLSLQPQWSEAILAGAKTVELRRTRSGCEPGTPVVIYTSHPVKRIEGRCWIAQVISGTPDEVWPQVQGRCGDTREQYDDYYRGATRAFALVLSDVERVAPVRMPFAGPQSFRYLFADEPEQRVLLAAAGIVPGA